MRGPGWTQGGHRVDTAWLHLDKPTQPKHGFMPKLADYPQNSLLNVKCWTLQPPSDTISSIKRIWIRLPIREHVIVRTRILIRVQIVIQIRLPQDGLSKWQRIKKFKWYVCNV